MKFRDIIGHKKEIRKIVGMADQGKIPHALLFHGPSGIGKTSVARAFMQYILCSAPQGGDSCGKCPNCLQTASLNNPDVHYVYPVVKNSAHPKGLSAEYSAEWASFLQDNPFMSPSAWLEAIEAGNSRPVIYVTESEEMLRAASLSSYGGSYKIFFVWLPEKMNVETANKLLKIIEEPFDDTIFIFVSNDPGSIIPTVRSRLQGVEFSRLPDEEITEFLIGKGKTPAQASAIAKIARGDMNSASLLASRDGETDTFRKDFIGVMRACYTRKMPELRAFSDSFAGYGREKGIRLLHYFSRMVRESFISNLKCGRLESMTPDEDAFVEKFGPFINAYNVEEMISEIDRAREDISRNANQKIVWFDLLVTLTRLIRTSPEMKKTT